MSQKALRCFNRDPPTTLEFLRVPGFSRGGSDDFFEISTGLVTDRIEAVELFSSGDYDI